VRPTPTILVNAARTTGHRCASFELEVMAFLTDLLLASLGVQPERDASIKDSGPGRPGRAAAACTVHGPADRRCRRAGTYSIDGNPLPQAPRT
jgi:hypothetical protein